MNQLLKVAAGGAGLEIRRNILRLSQSRTTSDSPLSEPCSGALARFAANSEAAAAGILSSFNAPLLVFADPLVAKATEASEFSFLELRRSRTSIYVCVDPQNISAARVILNLFFTQLIFQNTTHLPQSLGTRTVPCLLVMDEFTSIGRLEILAHAIAFMAGYDLRLLTIVQSIAQLVGVYGEADTRSLLANHALRVIFAPNELRDAREISELLGTTTLLSRQHSETRVRGLPGRRTDTYRNVENPRPLLLPQELRNLGKDTEVILLSGSKPILANKIRYFEDPDLRNRSVMR
jgi:type IV secretion system protein VirD4